MKKKIIKAQSVFADSGNVYPIFVIQVQLAKFTFYVQLLKKSFMYVDSFNHKWRVVVWLYFPWVGDDFTSWL